MFVLNNTTDELLPVFHDQRIFVPPTLFVVTNDTVPLQASAGPVGVPTLLVGGAVLTYTVAVPEPVPPVGQVEFPTAVTV